MLNPDSAAGFGKRYTVEYLNKGGYVVNEISEAAGPLFIEAEKLNKKYIFGVKTVANYSSAQVHPDAQDLSYEEKRSLIAACSKTGAIAMLAIVEIYGDTDKEGSLIQPLRFKRL